MPECRERSICLFIIYHSITQGDYRKAPPNILLNGERLIAFLPRLVKWQKCSFISTSKHCSRNPSQCDKAK